MLRLADLAAYVTTLVPTGWQVNINRMPDTPDEVVMVAIVPGGMGLLTDGAFQDLTVHVRTRATSDATAESVALAVDAGLTNVLPLQLGACFVRDCCPVGAPPCFFERDPENRTTYFCDYRMEASR